MIDIRRVTGAENEEADHIWLEAFQAGTFSKLAPLREGNDAFLHRIVRFGLWDGTRMQAGFQMFDNHLHYGPKVILPTAYISSVAVRPAARGRGYGSAVLCHMLEHMREAGQVFVTLTPFSYDYYRCLGWEWMGASRTYRAATRVLPTVPATDRVRAAMQADIPGIQTMYGRFARDYRGMAVRDAGEWNLVLGDTKEQATYSYLYQGDSGIEGYLVFSGGNGQEVSLTEFLTVSPSAQRELLGLLRRFHMQTKSITWEAPDNDGLWLQVMDREIETTLRPAMIGRVVDVAVALAALRPETDVSEAVIVEIHDPVASWNTKTWQVTIEGGVVFAQPVSKEPELRMDIQAFSQAYMGALCLKSLRKGGRIEVLGESAFEGLCRLLDGPPNWAIGPF
jgi:predicted acetyltransferase